MDTPIPDRQTPWWLTPRGTRALWLLAGLLLVTTLFFPITRTQEARVLATAREMLESRDARQWLVPRLNGEIRLQKPPLPYWLSATSYSLFGVSEWAGRLPMALSAWLMLAVTFRMARRMFDVRVAFFAAATLAGTFMFSRYGRLAETDILSAFFATASVYFIWRCFETNDRATLNAHFAAASVALTVLAKGPPAIFPVLFLLAFAAVRKRWDVPRRFVRSGALLTLALVGLPWFLYVRLATDAGIIGHELEKIAGGSGHAEPFWYHFPLLFKVTAPWVAFVVLGVYLALEKYRSDPRCQAMLLWFACVIVPLSAVGQKQEHYLVPALPPLMILAGWGIARALPGDDKPLTRFASILLKATLLAGLLTPVAIVVGARYERGRPSVSDWIMGATAFLTLSAAVVAGRRNLPTAFAAATLAWAVVMTGAVGVWASTIDRTDWRETANVIRRHAGDSPLAFHGAVNDELVFYLRTIIPFYETPDELLAALHSDPDLTLIVQRRPREEFIPPAGLAEVAEVALDEKIIEVFRRPPTQQLPP